MAGAILVPVSAAFRAQGTATPRLPQHRPSEGVAHPEFLPPPGVIPAYAYGPTQLEAGASASLARFADSIAHHQGPATLNTASHWIGNDGDLDYLLYNYLFMCTLDKVSREQSSTVFSGPLQGREAIHACQGLKPFN